MFSHNNNNTLILITITLIMTAMMISAQSTTPVVTQGYDSDLAAFRNFADLSSVATVPTNAADTNTAFYIHLFESLENKEASVGASSFYTNNEIPIMLAPICVAYNATKYSHLENVGGSTIADISFDMTLDTLGAWMRNGLTDTNQTLTGVTSPAIGASQMKLVLAANSPTTRAVLTQFLKAGVAGYSSSLQLPADVLSNTDVTFVADDDAVAATLKANTDTVGFVAVARGELFPCSQIRVTDPDNGESFLTAPNELSSANPSFFTESDNGNNISHFDNPGSPRDIYPLYGRVFLSFRRNSDGSCDAVEAAIGKATIAFTQKLFTDTSLFSRLRQWGMLALDAQIKISKLTTVIEKYEGCADASAVKIGGSSAIYATVLPWVLDYLGRFGNLMTYEPFGSGSGQRGIKSRTIRLAGSDALWPEEDFAIYPNVRVFPAVAFGVSIIVNLPGIPQVVLGRCQVVDIFNGNITRWNDAAIQNQNRAVLMPDEPIDITVNTGRSGTTEVFLRGLSEVSKRCTYEKTNGASFESVIDVSSTWNLSPVTSPQSGSSAAVSRVRATKYSIGFISSPSIAEDTSIQRAVVINTTTLQLTSSSTRDVESALDTASIINTQTGEVDLSLVASSSTAWPFIGVSNFIFEDLLQGDNCSEVRQALDFAFWASLDPAARELTVGAGYVPLPPKLSSLGRQKLIDATCNGLFVFPLLRNNATDASGGLSTPAIVGLSVGIFLLIAIVIGLLMWWMSTRGKRNLKHAVTDNTTPFACIFTDIQSSTTLWSCAPAAMAIGLDLHNQIIRDCIEKYDGFEVKTVGDAFLICCKDIKKAHEMCMAIQLDLFHADWPQELQETYQELFADPGCAYQQEQVDAEGNPILYHNRMDPRLFSGVTVRIGMSFSTAEPKIDQATGAVDYLGPLLNLSSRCESSGQGGQTIYSIDAINALREAGVDLQNQDAVSVKKLGKQMLKGIPVPVELFQVLPPELSGRMFPSLRCDSDGAMVDEYETNTDYTGTRDGTLNDSRSTLPGEESKSTNNNGTRVTGSMDSSGRRNSDVQSDVDSHLPSEARLCKFLASQSKVDFRSLILIFDVISGILSANPEESQRVAVIQGFVKDWRVQDYKSHPQHRAFKKEVGFEVYWTCRVAQKIQACVRLRQRKRDPTGELNLVATEGVFGSVATLNTTTGGSKTKDSVATSNNLAGTNNAGPLIYHQSVATTGGENSDVLSGDASSMINVTPSQDAAGTIDARYSSVDSSKEGVLTPRSGDALPVVADRSPRQHYGSDADGHHSIVMQSINSGGAQRSNSNRRVSYVGFTSVLAAEERQRKEDARIVSLINRSKDSTSGAHPRSLTSSTGQQQQPLANHGEVPQFYDFAAPSSAAPNNNNSNTTSSGNSGRSQGVTSNNNNTSLDGGDNHHSANRSGRENSYISSGTDASIIPGHGQSTPKSNNNSGKSVSRRN